MFVFIYMAVVFSIDKDLVTLSHGQLTGLIIGLVLFAILAVIVAVLFTRKKYVGSFGSTAGAIKFQEEVGRVFYNVCHNHYANTPMQQTAIFHGCKNDNFH